MGVERKISTSLDILPELFFLLSPRFPAPPHRLILFPNGVQMPGWKHCWDNILQKTLHALPYFPLWLSRFKATIGFFRVPSHKTTACRRLRAQRLPAVAELLERSSLPRFAEWRWSTLHDCLEAVSPWIDSVRRSFDPSPFRKGQDTVRLASMLSAFASQEWRGQFDFIHYITSWLDGLLRWGSGCDCHEEALARGEQVSCNMKGRRLPSAMKHIESELATALQTSRGWAERNWKLGYAGLAQAQGLALIR